MFIRNAWYVAAWSSEVAERPVGRTFLGRSCFSAADAGNELQSIRRVGQRPFTAWQARANVRGGQRFQLPRRKERITAGARGGEVWLG